MTGHGLKAARLYSLLIHLGYALTIVLLVATDNWLIAFSGLTVALFGFALTGQAALCPKCAGKLLEQGPGIRGVVNVVRLTAGKSLACHACDYETRAADHS